MSPSHELPHRELTIVKLGGSLITDKRREAHARNAVIHRLSGEVATALPELGTGLVIGHGSGSFGHVAAHRYGLGKGPFRPETSEAIGVGITQDQAARLHRLVMHELLEQGVPAFGWAPSSALVARRGKPVRGTIEPLWEALANGWVPVIYGDVITDLEWGAGICSTETAVAYLVGRWRRRGVRVRRVIWCGETRGIYDRDGTTIETLDSRGGSALRSQIEGAAGTDVTGGMRLRLDTALALARAGIESLLIDGRVEGLLGRALAGGSVPGTRVLPEARSESPSE